MVTGWNIFYRVFIFIVIYGVRPKGFGNWAIELFKFPKLLASLFLVIILLFREFSMSALADSFSLVFE